MKTSKELREERGLLDEALIELRKTIGEDEPTEEQHTEFKTKLGEIKKINSKIEVAAEMEAHEEESAKRKITIIKKVNEDPIERVNILEAIDDLVEGRVISGANAELNAEAKREFSGYSPRTFNIPARYFPSMAGIQQRTDIDQATSAIQATIVGPFEDALREMAVHRQVGINVVPNLTGDYKIPITGKHSVAWAAAENSAAADVGVNFTTKTLSPERQTGKVLISDTLNIQNPNAQAQVFRELGLASAFLTDDSLFSTATVSNAPTSIAATSGVLTFTEAAAYAANVSIFSDIVDAETTLADGEALFGSLAYVGNPTLLADLKQSAQVSNVNPAMTGNLAFNQQIINGYRIFYTVGATKSAGVSGDFIFGNFSKVTLGEWGGLSIGIDPFTKMDTAQVRLVLHKYMDWALVQGGAFVKATSLVA